MQAGMPALPGFGDKVMIKLLHPLRCSLAVVAIILFACFGVYRQSPISAQTASACWSQVPAILSRVKAPTFPNRDLTPGVFLIGAIRLKSKVNLLGFC
jgi:hypothetical protein